MPLPINPYGKDLRAAGAAWQKTTGQYWISTGPDAGVYAPQGAWAKTAPGREQSWAENIPFVQTSQVVTGGGPPVPTPQGGWSGIYVPPPNPGPPPTSGPGTPLPGSGTGQWPQQPGQGGQGVTVTVEDWRTVSNNRAPAQAPPPGFDWGAAGSFFGGIFGGQQPQGYGYPPPAYGYPPPAPYPWVPPPQGRALQQYYDQYGNTWWE